MKDCCCTNESGKPKTPGFKKWFTYILYVILVSIVLGAFFM